MAEEAKAEVIDDEITPLSGAEKWLAEASKRVDKAASQYFPYEIESAEMLSQAKRERAAIRRDASEIDNERKSMTRVIDDAVKKFRNDTKALLKPLTDLDEAYKAEIDAYAERQTNERKAHLEEMYRDLAPLLAIPSDDGRALVPFDRLLERYGMGQLGKKWLLQGTSVREAEQELEQALDQIQQYEKTITNAVAPSDADDIRAIYFDTLDMGVAMAELDKRKRQKARLEALEQERQWTPEPEPEPMLEPVEPMPEPSLPMAQSYLATDGIDGIPMMPHVSAPSVPRVSDWVFVCYCDRSQADQFAEMASRMNLRFRTAETHGYEYKLTRK